MPRIIATRTARKNGGGGFSRSPPCVRCTRRKVFPGTACRARDLAYGLIVSRVFRPSSKLSTLTGWADTTLGADLGITGAGSDFAQERSCCRMDFANWLRPAGTPT